MNLTYAMMVRNEREMLKKTLPKMSRNFDFIRKIALDTGSTDGTPDILKKHGFRVCRFKWMNNFADARNALMDCAREFCYDQDKDWIVMVDADEVLHGSDMLYRECYDLSKEQSLIGMPRINFARNDDLSSKLVWEYGSYPDLQVRCIRASSNLRFRNAVHEQIGDGNVLQSEATLYHYGWCKSPAENYVRSHNYVKIEEGGELISEAPDWAKAMTRSEWIKEVSKRHAFRVWDKWHPLIGEAI